MEKIYVIFLIWMYIPRFYHFKPVTTLCEGVEGVGRQKLLFYFPVGNYHNDATFSIVKDKTTIAKCSHTRCENYAQRYYETDIRVNTSNSEIRISILIKSASKSDRTRLGNNWYILYNNSLIGSCARQSIAAIKNVSCQHNVTNDILKIICWSSQIQSEGKCVFAISEKLLTKEKVNTTIREISWNDNNQSGPTCLINLPLNESNPGMYELLVSMYPIVNDDVILHLGINKTIEINLGYPSVMPRSCPAVVEENSKVSCHCVRSDDSLINATVLWFYNGTSQNVTNQSSNVLSFFANRKQTIENFYCKATNNFGWENSNSTFFYSPAIVGKVRGISCKTELNTERLYSLTCWTDQVFPEALCKINVGTQNNPINITHINDGIVYDHQQIKGKPSYFKSKCSFNISKRHLSIGINEILVTMYPNVTGDEKGLQYGNNHSLSVVLEASDFVDQSKSLNPTSGAVMIASFVGVNVSICLIVLCVWCYKRKASKNVLEMCVVCTKKKNEYDEINDGYVLPVNTIYEGDEQFDGGEYMTIEPVIELHCYKHEVSVEHHEYDIIEDVIRIEIHNDQQVEEDKTTMDMLSDDKTKDNTIALGSENVTFDEATCDKKEV